jgi:hypothetical protein
MPTDRDVKNFFELRQGIQGLADLAAELNGAAQRFLDMNGIALAKANGTRGHHTTNGARKAATIREQVKRHYKKRRAKTAPSSKAAHGSAAATLERRRFTASVLEELDTAHPRVPSTKQGRQVIGSLVRRGYVKKTDDGYVRTTKEFVVEKPAGRAGSGTTATGREDLLTVQQAAKQLKISDSYVRILAKKGELTTRTEMFVPKGRSKAVPTVLLTRDEVQRYKAERSA